MMLDAWVGAVVVSKVACFFVLLPLDVVEPVGVQQQFVCELRAAASCLSVDMSMKPDEGAESNRDCASFGFLKVRLYNSEVLLVGRQAPDPFVAGYRHSPQEHAGNYVLLVVSFIYFELRCRFQSVSDWRGNRSVPFIDSRRRVPAAGSRD